MKKTDYIIDEEQEKKDILNKYKRLLSVWKPTSGGDSDTKIIRKAFNLAVNAHKDMRRKSGEPYIMHPLEVAIICVEEIGLGETSIVCALLHDVVEDTDYTLEDMRVMFNDKVAQIIDGLTKIDDILGVSSDSLQAENFRKILYTLNEDVRVILVKMADRLHNMRTLEHMRRDKQLKIASETLSFFAPLAHRLGLYAIKSEFEDLSMKYTEPEVYFSISEKMKESEKNRDSLIADFTRPLKVSLEKHGFKFRIEERSKSIYSIWKKLQDKQISLEEVYDLFAIRIIIIIDTPIETEKADCLRVYSLVTDHYSPKPDRLRDWISIPKANGYESFHTTVMSKIGQWVDVQIRSVRMDEIAERGYAAHWKYKDVVGVESGIDKWLNRVRKLMRGDSAENAISFMEDFKLNLFTDEVFIFTPQGEVRTLPANSTVLDFAYTIHSDLGNYCIGAKINHKLHKISDVLKSGDQVHIITSNTIQVTEDWLSIVQTARAKSKIKDAITKYKKSFHDEGLAILQGFFDSEGINFDATTLGELNKYLNIKNTTDLYFSVANKTVTLEQIRSFAEKHVNKNKKSWFQRLTSPFSKPKNGDAVEVNGNGHIMTKGNSHSVLLDSELDNVETEIASCCNPIPGDDVMGYLDPNKKVLIHNTSCSEAIKLMATYGNKIIKLNLVEEDSTSYLAGIKIKGLDEQGLINKISHLISLEHNTNMKSIHVDANEGIVDGEIQVYVKGKTSLNQIMKNLKKLPNIKTIFRISRV